MRDKDKTAVLNRIEKIAQKVYRQHENAVYMLINDLEDFFEVNNETNDVNKMTSREFDMYIDNILDD